MRAGLLRFVLERDGYEVVAEATTAAELSLAISAHQPDIVVLNEMLGAAGLELSKHLAPEVKVVVVQPGSAQPVGADARVDPGSELLELGAAVERVAGVVSVDAFTETFDRPDWITKVRKDPAKLREILATGRTTPATPSVNRAEIVEIPDHGGSTPVVIIPAATGPTIAKDLLVHRHKA